MRLLCYPFATRCRGSLRRCDLSYEFFAVRRDAELLSAVAVHIDALPSRCGAVQCSSLPSLFCASQRSAVALLVLDLLCHAFALLR